MTKIPSATKLVAREFCPRGKVFRLDPGALGYWAMDGEPADHTFEEEEPFFVCHPADEEGVRASLVVQGLLV